MKNEKLELYEILVLIVIIVLAAAYFVPDRRAATKNQANVLSSSAQAVSAQEIYPLFLCPCCDKPLDPKNICCGMAQERITYIDGLAAVKISKEEAVMAYVKKYGLNSFVDKNQAEEFRKELAANAPANRPIISVSSESIDLGNVSQSKGEISTLFEITNTGKTDLIINKLDTSCGCTSAAVVFNGEEGPRFAMAGHGIESPAEWQVIIPPGEEAKLKVYYDPDVHKDFRGAATREIYIFSNDPLDFEKVVSVDLNQID